MYVHARKHIIVLVRLHVHVRVRPRLHVRVHVCVHQHVRMIMLARAVSALVLACSGIRAVERRT